MSSYKQHPRDHTSLAPSYCFSTRAISGALNHLELTWDDMDLFLFLFISLLVEIFLVIMFLICWLLLSDYILLLTRESLTLLVLPLPDPSRLSGKVLEIPKSQIFTWQSAFIKIFAGLRSRWITLAEWIYLRAHKRLYRINLICSSEILTFGASFKSSLRSVSSFSITMKSVWEASAFSYESVMIISKIFGTKQQCSFLDVDWIYFIIWISLTSLTQS